MALKVLVQSSAAPAEEPAKEEVAPAEAPKAEETPAEPVKEACVHHHCNIS